MSRFVRIGLVAAAVTLFMASVAVASVPDPNYSTVVWTCPTSCCYGTCEFPTLCPNGDDGNKPNYLPEPEYIQVTVRDQFGVPMAGIPAAEIYAYVCAACNNPALIFYGDHATDVAGHTTITVTKVGGCCTNVPVFALGVNLKDLNYRSYDFNGDLAVDLSDLTFLARTYNKGTGCTPPNATNYNSCFDFTCNNCVDLSDLTLFAKHYNHTCTSPLP